MIPWRLYIVNNVFSILPATRFFGIKRNILRWAGADVGHNVKIVSSARFHLSGNLKIGCDTWIGHEVLIIGGDADVIIGSRVDIAPRVTLVTGTHDLLLNTDRVAGRGRSLPIHINDGVWIGACSTILGGVKVGQCSMIAAGALVNQDISQNCVVGGVPARAIDLSAKNT